MWMRTNTRSNTNWLDKLRKVKGFPSVNDGHNLDNFLYRQPHRLKKPNDDDRLHQRDLLPENDEVSTRMANMLSDLFSDGRSSSARSLNFKAPRKQPTPRICFLPAAAIVTEEDKGSNDSERVADAVVVDDDWNLKLKRKVGRGLKVNEKDEERRMKLVECDLVGFSRTEVTIIDSSYPLWKFDKYLYRKKNVWKARNCPRGSRFNYETKKCVGIGRKKNRKREGFVDDDDDAEVVVRKVRVLVRRISRCMDWSLDEVKFLLRIIFSSKSLDASDGWSIGVV